MFSSLTLKNLLLAAKITILLIILPFTSSFGDDFDYDFLYAMQGTSAMGFYWARMTTEEKSAYLTGYEDGYLNSLAYHVEDKEKRQQAVEKMPSFYDAEKSNRDSLIEKIDTYYAQAEAYKVIPVPLVIRLVINTNLGIQDERNRHMMDMYEKELMKATTPSKEQNKKQ